MTDFKASFKTMGLRTKQLLAVLGKHPPEICNEIETYNRVRVLLYTSIAALGFLALATMSPLTPSVAGDTRGYGIVAVFAMQLLLVSLVNSEWNLCSSTVLAYLFYAGLLLYTGYLGTFGSQYSSATAFCVLLVVAPLLFIMDIRWATGISCTAVFGFCVAARVVKTPEVASIDMVNAVFFLLISVPMNASAQAMKRMNILQRHYIEHERDTDRLTGLLEKHAFELRIRQYLRQESASGCLIIMDLDRFKTINDTYGHAVGDLVLAEAGQRIQNCFRSNDMKGRFGGDEFIVFLPNVTDPEVVNRCIDRWVGAVEDIHLPELHDTVSGCAGAAYVSAEVRDYEALFRQADSALYQTKNAKHTKRG
ncbi:MAG: GGDEF domain-containing protein [Oscillibacter sp.]|nr:GGDEF domain-containing protein [Oscillibacter sp.]